ncbi:acyl-CoA dehydrogenase family protein [Leptospira sp. GIMC2001]|uniref:acyl-CoA dehydrogenase family protein n=1 Tax=Leptospira sp. GIMC2001 TaxID=1513297 RepID=UPI002349DC4F|nr:acyl-CoA dehydrogenase family protein [Leptospira sp. GIMC2001]WCL48770.1 acyl-CoA dehydrogenase family protein [Leptospira sp. GIMC2001]
MNAMPKENPALEEFDISNYKGCQGQNFYLKDKILNRIIERYSSGYSREHKAAMIDHLTGYGELSGGILNQLTEASHKEGKYGEIQKYDRTGNRVDNVVYSPEQLESRQISYDYGVVNLDFHSEWKFPFTFLHRYALAYLVNLNGEGGVSCPLAMTDGMILALKKLGTDSQKEKYLTLVAGADSDSHFMCGQYVTERVGGSNVGANRTIARKRSDGKWILTGEKWFCSNPGDLWVTTAKIEGTNTIGMFLVPRFQDDGKLNNHHILRKKDIIGSRGKVTAEVVYDEVVAEELGRPGHGLANMIQYIIKTSRIHVGLGASGNARRAVMEAMEYSKWRTAYGKKIQDFPAYARLLVEMYILHSSNLLTNFRMVARSEEGNSVQDVLIPLMKYKSSSLATNLCRTAILCLGGNGIIGDFSPIPRLLNDSIINESWEGTHLIISDHCMHALGKRKVRDAFEKELETNVASARNTVEFESAIKFYDQLYSEWSGLMNLDKYWKEANRVFITDKTYDLVSLSIMIEEAYYDYRTLDNKSDLGNSDIYLMLDGYMEILEKGIDGPRNPDRSILNPTKVKLILEYA